jgi:lipid-binding SYLF domain-containing protein
MAQSIVAFKPGSANVLQAVAVDDASSPVCDTCGCSCLCLIQQERKVAMKIHMKTIAQVSVASMIAWGLTLGAAQATTFQEATSTFRSAGASGGYFADSYAYAVFPSVGSGALAVGGAFGKGRVYVHGRYVGDTKMTQLSLGFQAGGKAYSEIIFFEDKRALDEFESGSFAFGADASVVAITAGANADAATTGASAGASAGPKDAITRGKYYKGMAVFTVAKGGLMYAAAVEGQKFSYEPRGRDE